MEQCNHPNRPRAHPCWRARGWHERGTGQLRSPGLGSWQPTLMKTGRRGIAARMCGQDARHCPPALSATARIPHDNRASVERLRQRHGSLEFGSPRKPTTQHSQCIPRRRPLPISIRHCQSHRALAPDLLFSLVIRLSRSPFVRERFLSLPCQTRACRGRHVPARRMALAATGRLNCL
jgi:hypothetical protein